jgi:hypothetical protein
VSLDDFCDPAGALGARAPGRPRHLSAPGPSQAAITRTLIKLAETTADGG